jgi:hypothetical protein
VKSGICPGKFFIKVAPLLSQLGFCQATEDQIDNQDGEQERRRGKSWSKMANIALLSHSVKV